MNRSPVRIERAARWNSLERTLEAFLLRENARLARAIADLAGLEDLAYCDPLTGLRNRRFFDERLDEELARTRRNGSGLGSVIVVDIDDFKGINDRYGHDAGDAALRSVAERLVSSLRLPDVCCRIGGDEFALILPDTAAEGAARVVHRLRPLLCANPADPIARAVTGVSLGWSSWPTDGCEARTLVHKADLAMYADKQAGARRREHRGRASDVGPS